MRLSGDCYNLLLRLGGGCLLGRRLARRSGRHRVRHSRVDEQIVEPVRVRARVQVRYHNLVVSRLEIALGEERDVVLRRRWG